MVTLRKMTQGLSACSEPLLVGGTSRLVTKTNRFWRNFLMLACRLDPQQLVEPRLQFGLVKGEGGVFEPGASAADRDGLLQELLDAGREALVAGIDGVLDIAQEMGEAGLMPRPGPAHLGAEPVGDPEFRAEVAEEFRDHRLAPARGDHEAGAVAVMEYPGPPGLLADPGAGLVGLQDGAR